MTPTIREYLGHNPLAEFAAALEAQEAAEDEGGEE